jgi:hypothetical protein
VIRTAGVEQPQGKPPTTVYHALVARQRATFVSMSIGEVLRWQWQGYARYHRARVNLVVHIIVVPVFLLGNATLVAAFLHRSWLAAGSGALAMVASMAAQGVGHRQERTPPEPFKGPRDAIARIFCEQWITFPRFVVTGGWLQAWRHTSGT